MKHEEFRAKIAEMNAEYERQSAVLDLLRERLQVLASLRRDRGA